VGKVRKHKDERKRNAFLGFLVIFFFFDWLCNAMFNLSDFSRIAGDSDDEVDPTSAVSQVYETNKYTVEGEVYWHSQ
jgi:hypothetical protein